jgi:indolepyruvate ferredoxin oxidoreductase beta subunit
VTDDRVTNIIMCGVGGQGVILASDILATAAMLAGNDVKKSEVHGMSQRGGSVNTHVRYGDEVHSPLISKGRADVMMAFEKLESLRYIDFMAPGGVAVVDDREVVPTTVSSGPFDYPEGILDHLQRHVPVIPLDCMGIARDVGNVRTANTVLLGAVSVVLDIPLEHWRTAVYRSVPLETEEINLKAFEEGRRRARELAGGGRKRPAGAKRKAPKRRTGGSGRSKRRTGTR